MRTSLFPVVTGGVGGGGGGYVLLSPFFPQQVKHLITVVAVPTAPVAAAQGHEIS